MEEKLKKIFTKENIVPMSVGGGIGILLTCLIVFSIVWLTNIGGLATLKFGSDAIATVDGKAISTQTIYDKAKLTQGLSLLINEVDDIILEDRYTLTAKEEKTAEQEAQYYIDYYQALGYDQEQFLKGNGFSSYEEFLDDIKASKKSDKYLTDYLEKKLEDGAVQKYYDENKDSLDTYDTEHILVQISDTVTDEQALALANEILGKLNEGKTFNEVVEEYKDRIVYEELGYNGKDASFEEPYITEMLALNDGEHSKTPVKTSYGYHIVHRIATSTFEDARQSIVEELASDIKSADTNITYKAFIELRNENNLEIFDTELKEQYQDYCDTVYNTNE